MINKRRILGLTTAILMGIGVAVALEAPASAWVYPHQITMGNLCLEAPAPGVPNDQLRLKACTGRSNQVFNFEDAGFDWGYFLHVAGSGLCLQPGAPRLYNSTIVEWYCDWASPQTWVLGRANSGGYLLYTTYSRWCIGVDFAYDGAYVRQTDCNVAGRRWDIV